MWLNRNILSVLVPAHQALPGLWQEPESKGCLCIHPSYIDFCFFSHVWHESSSEMRWQTFRMTFISAITRITQWKYFPDTNQMQCYDIEGLIVSGKQGSEVYFLRIFKTKVALHSNKMKPIPKKNSDSISWFCFCLLIEKFKCHNSLRDFSLSVFSGVCM